MEKKPEKIGYDRYLSSLDAWAIAFGCIVGWGAFVMPGTTFLPVAGPFGMQVHLAKPLDVDQLLRTLSDILQSRRHG